jgi:A/G-specific adenine glycosylase
MAPNNLPVIRRKLLRWYDKHRRDLPWRRTSDPYAIWIAETMLQQTQVATVAPYYERFLRALPTVRALDRAPLRKVLALWSGLGYYRRAENLKKSAREIVRNHGGHLPDDYHALLALPGVGDYTAGALLSIAFQKSYPAIDGNAHRVLYRLFTPKDDTELRQAARRLVPRSRPGYFNQGLMELGATICLAKDPRCPRCPLAAHCATRAMGRQAKHFRIKKSALIRDIEWPLAILRQDRKVLLRQRMRKGLLAGLWEFPGDEKTAGKGLRQSLATQLEELSLPLRPWRCIGKFRHSITNRKIRSSVYLIDFPEGMNFRLPNRRWRWLSPASLKEFPVSSMAFKAAKILANHEKNFS